MDDDAVRLDTRLAGQVQRYHTWPISRPQSIAEHTWQMLRIYMSIMIEPDSKVIYHILFHDIGEHHTGDVPYPVKSLNPPLKAAMDTIETESWENQLAYWDARKDYELHKWDLQLIKQIELIEMAEFGMDEMCRGNRHGFIIADRCLKVVYKSQPSPCLRLVQYVKLRLKVFFQQYQHVTPPIDQWSGWWSVISWEELNGDK